MIDQLSCGLFCHNLLGKIVQNGLLPALALLFLRMRRLSIKCDTHRDAVFCRHELDDADAVAESLLDQLVWHELGVRIGTTNGAFGNRHRPAIFLTVQAHGTNGRFPGQGSRFNSPHLHIFLHINPGLG